MKKLLLAFTLVSLAANCAWPQSAEIVGYKRTEDVIYARKFGTALTLDVFQPEKTNGCAVSRSRRG